METAINEIIEELHEKGIVENPACVTFKRMSGTTDCIVGLLSDGKKAEYVVKVDSLEQVQVVSAFLSLYEEIELLPKLLYVNLEKRYFVYSYIPGELGATKGKKAEILQSLSKNLLNHYRTVPADSGWGWADEISPSWRAFLTKRVEESRSYNASFLSEADFAYVSKLAESPKREPKEAWLLHGDCGLHNFLFDKHAKLVGVIDPIPVYGPGIHDLLFAFCSTPEDLTMETLKPALSALNDSGLLEYDDVREEVLLGLYCRIASCIKHHPHDLQDYLLAWEYWINRKSAL